MAGVVVAGIAAISGLAGAAIGGWASGIVSRNANAWMWNLQRMDESRAYFLEATEAIDEQRLALFQVLEDMKAAREKAVSLAVSAGQASGRPEFWYERPPEIRSRVAAATAQWRKVLAKRILFAEPDMADAMVAIDSARESIVSALNSGSLEEAEAGIELLGPLSRSFYRSVQRASVRHNLLVLNNVHPRLGRRTMRTQMLAELRELDRRDAEEQEARQPLKKQKI